MDALKLLWEKYKEGSLGEMLAQWKWILGYARRYKWAIIAYILFGLFSTVMSLAASVASKYLIDIVTGYDSKNIWSMGALMVTMAVCSLIINSYASRISLRINIRIQNDIQAEIFEKILHVNWLDLSGYHSGDILNRFASDVSTVAGSAIGWFPTLVTNLFSFVGSFAVIMYYDATMAWIALANAPILLVASRFLIRRMRQHSQELREFSSEMLGFQAETFGNLDSIKSFHIMDLFTGRLLGLQGRYRQLSLDYNRFTVRTHIWLGLLGMLVEYSCFGWGVYRLWTGAILYGTMTLFLTQAKKLSGNFSALVGIIPSTVNACTAAGRIMELVNLPPEEYSDVPEEEMRRSFADGITIRMEDVSFGYKPGQTVITDSGFVARPNEIVALVGPSGGGKTTMIRLILGLIHPREGAAVAIGADGREVPLGPDTRRFCAYVPQGNSVFSGSVAENLRMVKPDATDEEIIEALKIACAWSFVEKLPEGINGALGEKGRGVSEGQAQRIAIARAVLRDAPVLLLDEATSALDVETERQVLRNIIRRRPNKTCIVTTHRPSVLNLCQRSYRVMDTRITELSEEESSRMVMDF